MIRKPRSRATRKVLIRAADGRQPSFHPSKEKALGGVSTSLAATTPTKESPLILLHPRIRT